MASPRLIVVDVEGLKNQPPFFFPLSKALTPTYDKARDSVQSSKLLSAVGKILGTRIIIDLDSSQATLVDRMGLAENKSHLEFVQQISRTEVGGFRNAGTPAPPESVSISSEQDMVTWLYWVRRLVDKGSFVVVSGSEHLPSIEQIKQMGDIRIGNISQLSGKDAEKHSFIKRQGTPSKQPAKAAS